MKWTMLGTLYLLFFISSTTSGIWKEINDRWNFQTENKFASKFETLQSWTLIFPWLAVEQMRSKLFWVGGDENQQNETLCTSMMHAALYKNILKSLPYAFISSEVSRPLTRSPWNDSFSLKLPLRSEIWKSSRFLTVVLQCHNRKPT